MHSVSVNHCNVVTQARIAKETGYQSLEFLYDKLLRYIDNGRSLSELRKLIANYGLTTSVFNGLVGIGQYGENRAKMLDRARRYTQICTELECPTMQILTQHCLDDLPEETRMDILTENLSEITRIGQPYGVRYRIEIICHTAFNSLAQALEVIRRVNAPNLGVVIDFWHFHGSGKQTPADVAKLDPALIYGVHFCDGIRGVPGQPWNEEKLRDYLPGQGEVDLQAWTDAVKATGFDGVWSAELLSPTNWERDLWDVAAEGLADMLRYYHHSGT